MAWQESVYSDGSRHYVQPEMPRIGDKVSIRLKMPENSEVRGVRLRRIKNGSEHLDTMVQVAKRGPWVWYEAEFIMNQPVIAYHFYIYTDEKLYFYNQYELTEDFITEDADFRLVAGYEPPAWVRRSVFYQIFPDRFFNGNPDNDVQSGEYAFDGHPTVKMAWGERPKEYDEVFCLDFYGGDLEGIEQKIPYLQEMGFNALYLNPIFHSATSHRYDCLDYFKVDPHLGGDEALASLSAGLKDRDMRLLLDVSINHTGTAHKWFNKESAFFPPGTGAYQDPRAKERHYYFFDEHNDYHKWYGVATLPTLNYTSGELRDILYRKEDSLVKKWLKPPYSIDGWRFDVANDMARNDAIDLSHEVWREIHASIKETNPEAYVLAEEWLDCPEYLQGFQWDSAMNYFGCARPIRQFVGDGDLFIGRDPEMKKLPLPMDAAQLKKRILQHLSRIPHAVAMNQFNLLDSHDVARLHNNPRISFGAYEIAVMLMYMLPGAPSVYYGDEVGLEGHARSVEGCRYPMEWEASRWNSSHVDLYKGMNRLKLAHPALDDGGFKFLLTEGRLAVLARFTEEEALVLAVSMETAPKEIAIPVRQIGIGGSWSWSEARGREVEGAFLDEGGLHLAVPPEQGVLLSFKKG